VGWIHVAKVISRPTVGGPVCPGITRPSRTCDQFFFLIHGICLQTSATAAFVVVMGPPSLTREWICNLQLLGIHMAEVRDQL
jgi:hypothetical protein